MRGAFLIVVLALGQCGTPEPEILPGPATPELFNAAEAACTDRGGTFGAARPGSSLRTCFITPRDAGQQCSAKTDCEGVCLARSRTCAPVIPLLGCNEVLTPTGARATECVD